MLDEFHTFVTRSGEFLVGLFVIGLFFTLIVIGVLYIKDRNQSTHSILRNYPVIGRFRYFFEFLGKFFRQYFFAGDREELPFNRATRTWVYKAAKNLNTTVAFGSTRDMSIPGRVLFVNCPYPTLNEDSVEPSTITIGPYVEQPYETSSFFNVSAMSFGALSKPAVLALSHGISKTDSWLNTGEGGVSPYHLEGGCDLVAQIGTAKYGFRTPQGEFDESKLQWAKEHPSIKMIEIKLSQGAKPGKGGILPGEKVTEEISKIRGIPVHQDSISPNRHPGMKSVSDTLDMVEYVRNKVGKPVGLKTVIGSGNWLHDLCKEIHKRGIQCAPDFLTIDSADGGTGAAPVALMDYMGTLIRESLPLTVDILEYYELKDRIKVIASGKLLTPPDVAWALCVGADFIASARGFMFALGCIQALQCNNNHCPTGITTHDLKLQNGLVPQEKAIRVSHYIQQIKKEVGQIAHSCGVKEPRQLQRKHCRIIQADGCTSVGLDVLYPPVVEKFSQ